MLSRALVLAQALVLTAGLANPPAAPAAEVPVRANSSVAQPVPVVLGPPRVRPAPKPKPKPKPRPRVTKPAPVAAPAPAPAPQGSSTEQRVMEAVARIPGTAAGSAHWVVSSRFSSWGVADWFNNTVYISPRVPRERIYDVVAHEWSHLLQVRAYGGSVSATETALNAWFGGSGHTGAERAADCMAIALGASWTNYTSCADAHWRAGAQDLLAGRRLG